MFPDILYINEGVFATEYANELSLDKEKTSYSDSLDALGLACKMYKIN